MPAKRKPVAKPMTPEAFQAKLADLELTRAKVCDAWQVSEGLISKWCNGKVPIPGWVRYALAGVPVIRAGATPIAAPSKSAETPNPVAAPTAPKPIAKPVQPSKRVKLAVDCAPPSVPGKWRFGVFYPD